MFMTQFNRVDNRTQTESLEDGYHSLSQEEFMFLMRAFEQVFGLLCLRETKHFRCASSIEPAYFSVFDQYQALVHMINTANRNENAEEITALRKLMVSYLGPLDQIIAIKLRGRSCFFIAPKVWLEEGQTQ